MDIYIGNLNYNLQEAQIRTLFEVFGQVTQITLLKDKESNKSRGKAFVVMPDPKEALKAIESLHGRTVAGRNIIVSPAHGKKSSKAYFDPVQLEHFIDKLKRNRKEKPAKDPREKNIGQKGVNPDSN